MMANLLFFTITALGIEQLLELSQFLSGSGLRKPDPCGNLPAGRQAPKN